MIPSLFTTDSRGVNPLPDGSTLISALVELSTLIDTPEKLSSRTGAVLALCFRDLQMPTRGSIVSITYGSAPFDRLAGWLRNAPEKIDRLERRRRDGHKEVTSAESADPENVDPNKRTFGGSVVFFSPVSLHHEIYFSISGAHPKVDEALAFAIGLKHRLAPAKIPHENPYLEQACKLLNVDFGLAAAA